MHGQEHHRYSLSQLWQHHLGDSPVQWSMAGGLASQSLGLHFGSWTDSSASLVAGRPAGGKKQHACRIVPLRPMDQETPSLAVAHLINLIFELDMECNEGIADRINLSTYKPLEHEKEKASNSYLMSLVAIIMGAPLPLINLMATLLFFLSNRKASPYVRWHCTQALLSQLTVFIVNSVGFAWTIRIAFYGISLTNQYIAYIITAIAFNLFEFILTIIAATRVRRGQHMEWWFWGALTHQLSGSALPMKNSKP